MSGYGNGPVATYGAASLDKSSATEGHREDTAYPPLPVNVRAVAS